MLTALEEGGVQRVAGVARLLEHAPAVPRPLVYQNTTCRAQPPLSLQQRGRLCARWNGQMAGFTTKDSIYGVTVGSGLPPASADYAATVRLRVENTGVGVFVVISVRICGSYKSGDTSKLSQ